MNRMVRVGGHLSIRKGFAGAALAAAAQGAGVFQYFPKNPRSLSVKQVDPRDAERCKVLCGEKEIVSVAHTPYPSNLALEPVTQKEARSKVVDSLRNDLEIAEACGSLGIVVHFGSSRDGNPLQIYKNIIQCINEVLQGWKGNALLLLENQAGDHGEEGKTLEEMVQIRKLCERPEHIGFCLDTCHAFAAGIWGGAGDTAFLDKARDLNYFEALKVLHFNDSKYPAGSRKDRHARVGTGHIGEAGFRWLLSIPELKGLPLVLESETGRDGTYMQDMHQIELWSEAGLE
ncbi:endonuclease IV [Paenibacillus sp. CAA11]|uniref:deoxyribonuclease IV n=1 Tax=Paenibacillus sp. CAA11 TaxID=1532905 RepID=UPI000D39210F|nr:deoxyribonuclease IV [Paenibacillus sp. CAA11]AWB44865.1 endonuclease IV [Paenibacillus sp. CAA11]